MNHSRTSMGVAAAVAAVIALAACGQKTDDGTTVGQKIDSGVQKSEQMAQNGMEKAREGTADASAAVKDAGEKMAAAVDDASITASVNASLAKDPDLSAIRINVDTKGGVVTLQGPAPSATARDRATDIARNVKGVSSVNNQLTVQAG